MGLKIIYKIFSNSVNNCNCNIKCVCSNVTLLIFQSGKVIITGAKSELVIYNVLKHFYNEIHLFNSHSPFSKN